MLASVIDMWCREMPPLEMIRNAVAVGTACVTTPAGTLPKRTALKGFACVPLHARGGTQALVAAVR